MRILVVEDDTLTLEHVRANLSGRGYEVETARDGRRGLERAASEPFDVLIIDRMLPELDGLDLLKALRTASVATPVIVLTAIGGIADRVSGLKAGADDYLVKPFDFDELEARIEALGRRPPMSNSAIVLRRSGLELNRLSRVASYTDQPLDLTSSEFAMLELLMLNPGRAVTKAMILETVFDLDATTAGHIVEPHMSRLRTKLDRAGLADAIRTLRGVGYALA